MRSVTRGEVAGRTETEALAAVADAGGLDAPNQVVVLRMAAPVTSP